MKSLLIHTQFDSRLTLIIRKIDANPSNYLVGTAQLSSAVQCRQRLKQTRSSQSTLSKWAWIDSALLPQLTVKSCLLKRKNDNSSMKNIPFVTQSYFLDCVLEMRLQSRSLHSNTCMRHLSSIKLQIERVTFSFQTFLQFI